MTSGHPIYELAEEIWPNGKSFKLVEDAICHIFAVSSSGEIIGQCSGESLGSLYENLAAIKNMQA